MYWLTVSVLTLAELWTLVQDHKNWVYLSNICRHFSYKDISMNKEIDKAPLISKTHKYKLIVFSSIIQRFWSCIKKYWEVIKLQGHLTSPFFWKAALI